MVRGWRQTPSPRLVDGTVGLLSGLAAGRVDLSQPAPHKPRRMAVKIEIKHCINGVVVLELSSPEVEEPVLVECPEEFLAGMGQGETVEPVSFLVSLLNRLNGDE